MAPYFPNISYISSAVILYGKFLTYRILLTSGGSLTYNKQNIYSIYHTFIQQVHNFLHKYRKQNFHGQISNISKGY